MTNKIINYIEHDYLEYLWEVKNHGESRDDRTGTGIRGKFFNSFLINNIEEEFPLLTTKKIWLKGIVEELRWFLSGSTNVKDLDESVRHLWSPWASASGDMGMTYGWRLRGGTREGIEQVDQINKLVKGLQANRLSRRHVMNIWDSNQENMTGLPWCHGTYIQFYVHNDNKLSLCTHQRSADLFLGLPFNLASYSLFLMLIANMTATRLGMFIIQLETLTSIIITLNK